MAGLCCACFIVYSFLALTAPPRFNSPDENANHYFTGIFAESGYLYSFESLNLAVPGLIHPRSVRVVDDFLVPGGFIGLPVIYGSVARVFGLGVTPFLTAFMAVLASLAFVSIVAKFFGRPTGYLAGWLLLINPVWWYQASRAFMPNSLFVSLLILAAWFMLVAPLAALKGDRTRRRWDVFWRADGVVAGVLLGLALSVRLSEIYWIFLAMAAIIVASFKKIPWSRLLLLLFFTVLMLLPFMGMNRSLYGSWTGTGYGSGLGGVPVEDLPAGRGAQLLGPLQPFLFPLGFAPRTAWRNFWTYGVAFFWWWSVLVGASLLVAAVHWLRRRPTASGPAPRAFAVAAVLVGLWLSLFYGSWTIHDNPDPQAVTIGTSYLRYWLPLFVLSTVPVAWALTLFIGRLPKPWRKPLLGLFLAGLTLVSGLSVFGSEEEGLLAVRASLSRYDREVEQVLAATEPDALIIVDRADKLLFPERRVMYPLRSETTFAALPKLLGRAPLYYFGITFPEKDLDYLRREKLPPLGLTIEPVSQFREESLYSLRPLPPASAP